MASPLSITERAKTLVGRVEELVGKIPSTCLVKMPQHPVTVYGYIFFLLKFVLQTAYINLEMKGSSHDRHPAEKKCVQFFVVFLLSASVLFAV